MKQEITAHPSETWRKACACDLVLASGPRFVFTQTVLPYGHPMATTTYVRMACVSCDTPWTLEPPRTP